MTQLILDSDNSAVILPESQKKGYRAYKQPYHQDVKMASQRWVRELGGKIWMVNYQYGFTDEALKNAVIAACEKGMEMPIMCGFLPPNSLGELSYSRFWVETFDNPKFMWSTTKRESGLEVPAPLWADFSLVLREVKPGD